jgi:hypothetical protein
MAAGQNLNENTRAEAHFLHGKLIAALGIDPLSRAGGLN